MQAGCHTTPYCFGTQATIPSHTAVTFRLLSLQKRGLASPPSRCLVLLELLLFNLMHCGVTAGHICIYNDDLGIATIQTKVRCRKVFAC